MLTIYNKKCLYLTGFFVLTYCILIPSAVAISEASTSLNVYVPPGGKSDDTATYIIVTATLNDTFVDIIDLDTTIGDPTNASADYAAFPVVDALDVDLSEYNVQLDKGQSRVIKVSYKGGGPDSDGTYFSVSANKPVIVYTGMAEGRVEADFVPSNDGTMVGKSFFVYLPDCWDEYNGGRHVYDLAVFAFEDDTNVSVYNISTTQTLVEMANASQRNATTSINITLGIKIANETLCPLTPNKSLNRNPVLYLQAFNGSGIERGYTYFVSANKSVSVASVGVLNDNKVHNRSRDGAYYVPGVSDNPYHFGTGLAHTFYMQLNGPLSNDPDVYENEIYLINQNTTSTANVTIEEFNKTSWQWDKMPGKNGNITHPDGIFTISNSNITSVFSTNTTPPEKWDGVKRYNENHTGLVRVTSYDSSGNPMDISVFAGVWLETTGKTSFTADIAAFTSGDTGYGGAKETILYVPPPGKQPFFNDTTYAHVYIYVYHNNTNITIQGWKNNQWQTVYHGEYINVSTDQIIDYRVNFDQWHNGTDKNGSYGWDFHRLRVLSTKRTTVQINNWNDNWASYVTGGTPPLLTAGISVQNRYLTINTIPVQRVKYSFDISNEAINNVGSNLKNLYVVNTIPEGIDQKNIFWSIRSNMDGLYYDSSSDVPDSSVIANGTKYVWQNSPLDIEVTAYAYNNGSGTVLVFNKTDFSKLPNDR
jgi:hypothetical protein